MHTYDISQKFWICDTRVNPPRGTCLTKSLSYLFESMHGTEIVPVLFSQGNLDEKYEKAGVTSFLFQPRSWDTTKNFLSEFFFKWKFTSDRDFVFFFFFEKNDFYHKNCYMFGNLVSWSNLIQKSLFYKIIWIEEMD